MSVDLGRGVVLLERHETGVSYAGRARMRFPVGLYVSHHSVTGRTGDPVRDALTLDGIGRSRGHRGMSYLYAIEGLVVVEGQGDYIGAHTLGHNSDAIGVVFIGDFHTAGRDHLTEGDVRSTHQLRSWLIDTGRLRAGTYPTTDHQGMGQSTACAGDRVRSRFAELRAGGTSPVPVPRRSATMNFYRGRPSQAIVVLGPGGAEHLETAQQVNHLLLEAGAPPIHERHDLEIEQRAQWLGTSWLKRASLRRAIKATAKGKLSAPDKDELVALGATFD